MDGRTWGSGESRPKLLLAIGNLRHHKGQYTVAPSMPQTPVKTYSYEKLLSKNLTIVYSLVNYNCTSPAFSIDSRSKDEAIKLSVVGSLMLRNNQPASRRKGCCCETLGTGACGDAGSRRVAGAGAYLRKRTFDGNPESGAG